MHTPGTAVERRNLFDWMLENGNFTELVLMLTNAGLDDLLTGGTYTLFAPDDAAFVNLGEYELAGIRRDLHRLEGFVKNLIAEGAFPLRELLICSSLRTLGDKTLLVDAAGGRASVDGVAVTREVLCRNGVLHQLAGVPRIW